MSVPKVNVVIPTHKGREHYVAALLDCLSRQTFTDFDVIITDNNPGADPEPDFVKTERFFKTTYIVNSENIGPLKNTAKVLGLAKAKYVKPMMSDDLVEPSFLETAVRVMESNPTVSMVFGKRVFVDDDENEVGKSNYHSYEERASGLVTARELLADTIGIPEWFPGEPSNFLIRNHLVDASIMFQPIQEDTVHAYEGSFDLIWYLKLLEKGDAYFVNRPLTLIRQHPGRAVTSSAVGLICRLDYFYFARDALALSLIERACYEKSVVSNWRYLWSLLVDFPTLTTAQTVRVLNYISTIIELLLSDFAPGLKGRLDTTLASLVWESSLELARSRLIDALVHSDKKMLVYGTSTFASRFLARHPEVADRVFGFVNSDPQLSGKQFEGKRICHPSEIERRDDAFLLILSSSFEEISQTLRSYGFQPFKDFIHVPHLF